MLHSRPPNAWAQSYADIRINRCETEAITTREQQVQNVSRSQNFGFGVRVLVKGTWGFAASPFVAAAGRAPRHRSGRRDRPRQLARSSESASRWCPSTRRRRPGRAPFEKDPFDVPIDDKIQFLLKLNEAALETQGRQLRQLVDGVGQRAESSSPRLTARASSNISSAAIPDFTVTAVDRDDRRFPDARLVRRPAGHGLRVHRKAIVGDRSAQAGEEAVMKLKAKPVEPGKYDLVLHPSHLWLTIHESVGHPTELDRALWWEANYAGTSFLTPDKTGKLQFGSKIVNFVADRTQPAGPGDRRLRRRRRPGTALAPGQGRHVRRLADDARPGAADRAQDVLRLPARRSWGSVPFPRMPNVSLEPATADNARWTI